MPNGGIPPYVPMPPVLDLTVTGQHAAGWNRMASGQTGNTMNNSSQNLTSL